jgi:hypothetical protein
VSTQGPETDGATTSGNAASQERPQNRWNVISALSPFLGWIASVLLAPFFFQGQPDSLGLRGVFTFLIVETAFVFFGLVAAFRALARDEKSGWLTALAFLINCFPALLLLLLF